MAEIRCPMCGKDNPDDLDICQFCEARLKPLIAATPPEDTPTSDASQFTEKPESSSDLPDWLDVETDADFEDVNDSELTDRALQDDGTPFEGEDDDWLSRLAEVPEFEDKHPTQPEKDVEEQDVPGKGSSKDDIPKWIAETADQQPTVPLPENYDDESPFPTEYIGQETLPIQDNQDDTDLPDWLIDREGEEASGDDEVAKPAEADHTQELDATFYAGKTEKLPDWLSEVGGEDAVEKESIPIQAPDSSFTEDEVEELPDWLSGEDTDDTEITSQAIEGELPDWLAEMDGEEVLDEEESTLLQASVPAFTNDDEDELPDWLSDSGLPESDTEIAENASSVDEGELPDWLTNLGGEEVAKDEEPITSEEVTPMQESLVSTSPDENNMKGVTDWLSEGGPDKVDHVLSSSKSEPPDSSGLEDAREAGSGIQDTDDNIPDWLAILGDEETARGEEAETSEETTPTQASVPAFIVDDEELQDLLSESDAEEAESVSQATESELPDWLADLGTEETADGKEIETSEEIAAMLASVPAVISDDEEKLSDSDAEEMDSAPPTDESDLPEWLADLDSDETAVDEELPDWLAEVEGIEAVDPEAGIPTFEDSDELPDWLSEVEGIEIEETKPEIEPDIEFSDFDESRAVPSWLHEAEEAPEGEILLDGDEEEIDITEEISFSQQDKFEDELSEFEHLPDWLSDGSQPETDQDREITTPDDEIAPAELPAWLAAMRPVEPTTSDAIYGEKRGPVESYGPLAGLYSVLTAEPEITQLKKPPVYSNKLQVTDAQQKHADLLRDLLEREGKVRALPSPPSITSQRVFRLILGLMLILMTLIAVMISGDIVGMPTADIVPSGIQQTYQIVTALSPENTALVAFDYEPGLVGEMDAAAAAVVDNMMAKGVKLVLVSTSPTGPALAERFINDVQGIHQYSGGTQYVNLGYIPGGISGLAAFAQNPSWVAPTTLDGAPAWDTEPLKNIQNVSDFALFLLITDNPNTARAWVEQVNPFLEPTPLVAVISAQVEPLVRIYHGQIDGLISGLTGGAAYEVMGGSNLAHEQWGAFNIILIIMVSAILIGAIVSIGSTMVAKNKENEGESA